MPDSLRQFKAEIFQALAHPTRIAILEQFRDGELTVSSFVERLGARTGQPLPASLPAARPPDRRHPQGRQPGLLLRARPGHDRASSTSCAVTSTGRWANPWRCSRKWKEQTAIHELLPELAPRSVSSLRNYSVRSFSHDFGASITVVILSEASELLRVVRATSIQTASRRTRI